MIHPKSSCGRLAMTIVHGSHGHEISGNILKLENTFSSTGKGLEFSKGPGKCCQVQETGLWDGDLQIIVHYRTRPHMHARCARACEEKKTR